MSLQANNKNNLPPDCDVLLNQIKQIAPKVFSYFQFDLFGLMFCIVIFILGLTPCIGFATISYNAQSGGTHPDTNENLRILLFVAPTTFLFATGFCVFRLTNRKFPWTQITFDFLEGSVTYRTGTGMRFLVNALCDLFCCGCFCFLSEDEILFNGAVDEAFSQGVRRAMFSEIKEIGVGSRFLNNNNGGTNHSETEYVVGLKIRRKRRRQDDDVTVASETETKSISRRGMARITIGAQRNKSNADYYLEDHDEEEKRRRRSANEEKDEMERELIVTPKSSDDESTKNISSHSNSHNGSNRSGDDNDDDDDASSNNSGRNHSKPSVPNAAVNRGNHDSNEAPLLNEESEKDSVVKNDQDDATEFEEYIEMVPLDVVTSKENVTRTIKFWKRWMRQHYDSADEDDASGESGAAGNEETRIRMKEMRSEKSGLPSNNNNNNRQQKESTPISQKTSISSRNPLTTV